MSRILLKGGSAEITEKKSRFIANLAPVTGEQQALDYLAAVKKQYWDARHSCHAYVIGEHSEITHCSDDGEPSGTAGKPMLAVLTGADLHNCIAVVTRYFGGVLLGTGGLVRAYTSAVQEALKVCETADREKGARLSVRFGYEMAGAVQYLVSSENIPVLSSEYSDAVTMQILVPEARLASLIDAITQRTSGKAVFTEEEAVTYVLAADGPVIMRSV